MNLGKFVRSSARKVSFSLVCFFKINFNRTSIRSLIRLVVCLMSRCFSLKSKYFGWRIPRFRVGLVNCMVIAVTWNLYFVRERGKFFRWHVGCVSWMKDVFRRLLLVEFERPPPRSSFYIIDSDSQRDVEVVNLLWVRAEHCNFHGFPTRSPEDFPRCHKLPVMIVMQSLLCNLSTTPIAHDIFWISQWEGLAATRR